MNRTPPSLRRHATGQWFVRWGGQDRYLGSDPVAAKQRYADEVKAWAEWRRARDAGKAPKASKRVLRVVDLYGRFIESRATECRAETQEFYRASLRRFVNVFGEYAVSAVQPRDIQLFKERLARIKYRRKEEDPERTLSRKTINHEIGCIKTLLQWGMDLDYMPPINLRGIRSHRLPPPQPKGYTLKQVRSFMRKADDKLKPWIAVNWLTACRPTETLRLVHRQGYWEQDFVFRLAVDKTGEVTGSPRRIVFSQLAREWFDKSEPVWARRDGYYLAWRRTIGAGGPHPLRHGAAMRLAELGVGREAIDLFLGHMPPRVSATYNPPRFQALREVVARLTL